MEDRIYRLVDEGNPDCGACYRIAMAPSPLESSFSEKYVSVSGGVGWDQITDFRVAVNSFGSEQKLTKKNFVNGYSSPIKEAGEDYDPCKLQESDFENVISGLI
jgi:hypothetical protein